MKRSIRIISLVMTLLMLLPLAAFGASDEHEHTFTSWATLKKPTCTEPGIRRRYCSICGVTEKEEIAALGHQWIGWITVKEPTVSEDGIRMRGCTRCSETESEPVAWAEPEAPRISTHNFMVMISNLGGVDRLLYAKGIYADLDSILAAEDLVELSTAEVKAATTKEGLFVYEMPSTGNFSIFALFRDGREFRWDITLMDVNPDVTTDDLDITARDLDNVNILAIAYGTYYTASDCEANAEYKISGEELGGAHSVTYRVSRGGAYTVSIRFNGYGERVFRIKVTAPSPSVVTEGLFCKVSKIKDLYAIRYAPGEWTSAREIRTAEGCRDISAAFTVQGADPFEFRLPAAGVYTLAVEFANGYTEIVPVDAVPLKAEYTRTNSTITFGGLERLNVVYYAPGEYSSIKEIRASGVGRHRTASSVAEDGAMFFSGLNGRYTFIFQFADYTVDLLTLDFEPEDDRIELGSNRQLLIDDLLIDPALTTATRKINSPEKKERVFYFDQTWERDDTVYHNIVYMPDGTYRMYYKALYSGRRRICYIESKDGLNWTRPKLSLVRYGSTWSNAVTDDSVNPDNLFVFYDNSPNCLEGEHLKGIYGQWGDGLFLELSTDDEGNEFKFWTDDPDEKTEVMLMGKRGDSSTATGGCFFDTLNTVHWDADRGKYVAFVRGFHQGDNYALSLGYVAANPTLVVRDIRYTESEDCYHWTTPIPLKYSTDEDFHMYANCATNYYRTKDLYIAIPTRYVITSMNSEGEITGAYSDNMLMASRDLVNWTRYNDQYMLPFDPNIRELSYGDCYPCVGMIETSPGELSLYMKEKVSGSSGRTYLYRYALRVDGFASFSDGTLTTLPVAFDGSGMLLNYKTAEGGHVRVTVTDNNGVSIASRDLTGDEIDGRVVFDGDLSPFAGKTVTVTFEISDAEIYSFKFE